MHVLGTLFNNGFSDGRLLIRGGQPRVLLGHHQIFSRDNQQR